MKRNLGYDMRRAEKVFFDSCDGTHIMHLIEVFERRQVNQLIDVTRKVGDVEDAGELWMCDEDGYNEIGDAGWSYEGREAVGFDRDELADMAETSRLHVVADDLAAVTGAEVEVIHIEEDMFRGDR